MYIAMLIAFYIVLPIASIGIEVAVRRRRGEQPDIVFIVARWFTFWIVGVRLFIAGALQALNPSYTAETIFGTTDPIIMPVISELGYANLAFGTIGIVSLFRPTWVLAAATAGAVFLGLDGLRHLIEGGPYTPDRMLALISDLVALVILAGSAIAVGVSRRKSRSAVAAG